LGLARLDAEWLLLHTLGRASDQRAWLRAHDTDPLPASLAASYRQQCQQRADQVPLAYLTGWRGFYGLSLQVDARVLDPRPDTETLVDWALTVLQPLPTPRVADLGTGSGAIALAIQHHRPDAQVLAVDASADALAVAQANAQRLGLPVQFAQGHWCQPLLERLKQTPHGGWDLIASNPPYIADADPHLAALRHEPRQALTSGPDGLDDIRHLIRHAPACLRPGGWLLLEHGHDQSAAVQALFSQPGWHQVQSRHDLSDHARCTGAQWTLHTDTRTNADNLRLAG
jgi:release factor glutamine methyltransferase